MPDFQSSLKATNRDDWRSWLQANHATATEVWLVTHDVADQPTLSYLDSVEEAICFGWIDGLAKRVSEYEKAQRFTPRRPRSNWTELNKERARRLIRLGLMTEAGRNKTPDLDAPFVVPKDIMAAINSTETLKTHFDSLPELYVRVRVGYIEEMRKRPEEFARRLDNFLRKTEEGKMFGNWNDGGRLQ